MVKIFKNLQKLNRKFIKKKIQQYIAFHYCECLAIGKRLGKIEETVKKAGLGIRSSVFRANRSFLP